MTAVPKPLKFLKPFYNKLKVIYESWPIDHELKHNLADVLSVLAMTMAESGSRESLTYKLQGSKVDISSWGHEYVRSLAGEISEAYNQRILEGLSDEDVDVSDLITLVDDIVPFQMKHNAEVDAVDLLVEVQRITKILDYNVIDDRNYERVCLYILRLCDYIADPDDIESLYSTSYSIYLQQGKYTDALRVAIRLDDEEKISHLLSDELDIPLILKKQLCYILAKHKSYYVHESEELNEIVGNIHLSDQFISIARSMDLLEPKLPDDIYKTHLINSGPSARRKANSNTNTVTDSARGNLAGTFVNAFVNSGYNNDKLLLDDTNISNTSSNWVFKNKDHGMISAVASLGMIYLWNIDEGFSQLDKYFHFTDDNVKAGACLGIGIVASGIRNESDPSLAILTEYLDDKAHIIRLNAIIGLGIAYAGSRKSEVLEQLIPVVSSIDGSNIIEVSFAALSLGLVFVGTCNDEISGVLVQRLMEASETELNSWSIKYLSLGLGLLYLGKTDKSDVMIEAVKTIEHSIGKYTEILIDSCAYAGTGNVLKIQSLLRICNEHLTEKADHQIVAVLGIALLSIGDEDLNPLIVNVRVGQAVETVGQAGRPKTITGFQTHTTPVLLGYRERAELANRDYISYSSVLENLVIVEKKEIIDDSNNNTIDIKDIDADINMST
eukprot:gene20341-26404_t